MGNTYLDRFMEKFEFEGLTFDDISMLTQYADFLPGETDISTSFSKNIKMNIPFVSAAMDTVTESSMAIAMAKLGGIGVIHKNLNPVQQADEVRKVKQYLNGLIRNPVVFNENTTVEEMLNEKNAKQYSFSGFPIVDSDGKLVGIITSRDIKFLTDRRCKVSDIMTRKVVSAPTSTQMEEAYNIMREQKVGKLPLVDESGHLTGLYSFQDVSTLLTNMAPDYNRDPEHRLRVAAAVSPYDVERANALVEAGVDALVIDTAHGHSKGVIETLKLFKRDYPEVDIVAGNIATGEAAKALLDAGADIGETDSKGRTALMHAAEAQRNTLEAVKLLIARGADPMAYDSDVRLAVMHAAALKHTDAALYLLDLIPDLPKKPGLGLMIMHSAIKGNDLKVMDKLIDRRVPLNRSLSVVLKGTRILQIHGFYRILIRNGLLGKGRVPLHWAAIDNNLDAVKLLIDRGADPLQPDELGHYADALATSREVIHYIRKKQSETLRKYREMEENK